MGCGTSTLASKEELPPHVEEKVDGSKAQSTVENTLAHVSPVSSSQENVEKPTAQDINHVKTVGSEKDAQAIKSYGGGVETQRESNRQISRQEK